MITDAEKLREKISQHPWRYSKLTGDVVPFVESSEIPLYIWFDITDSKWSCIGCEETWTGKALLYLPAHIDHHRDPTVEGTDQFLDSLRMVLKAWHNSRYGSSTLFGFRL